MESAMARTKGTSMRSECSVPVYPKTGLGQGKMSFPSSPNGWDTVR